MERFKARWASQRTRYIGPLLLMLFSFSALLACGGEEGGGGLAPDDGSAQTGGTGSDASGSGATGSGATGSGASDSGGTSSGGAGGSGSGGEAAGGADSGGASTGGSSGELSGRQCRTVADCSSPPPEYPGSMATARCASPFTPSGDTLISGVPPQPGWCGELVCPPLRPFPDSYGADCETDADCAQLGDDSLAVAHLCRAGSCVVCESDADCGSSLPFCATISAGATAPAIIETCVACQTSEDCTAETPFCSSSASPGPSCVECFSTQDCASGVCTSNRCAPGCTSDADCSDPALACSANARCEPRVCAADPDCPPNLLCQSGTCSRKSCSSDEDCDGVCVNQACFEDYGRCAYTIGLP